MIERDGKFKEALERSLRASEADETEILAFRTESGLTRMANSEIHQNVLERNSAVSVRAIIDKRIGTASTNRPDPGAIDEAVREATENARRSPRVEDWPGLPTNGPIDEDKVDEPTAACQPGKRAELISQAIAVATNNKFTAAGALATAGGELYVGNNHGPVSVSRSSSIDINMVMMALDSSGYAAWAGRELGDLRIKELSETAALKAEMGRQPADIKPGPYTVILEPAAVADLLSFLGYVGLGALSVQEKRSFMGGHFGERIVDDKITLWDDGTDERSLSPAFDYEGVPKQKVIFLNKGVAEAVVYDSRTAARDGLTSTGHALPAPNQYGPLPTSLFLAPGDTSLTEMINNTELGVYVTRFHYTNIEEPMRAVLTGMTRDGTFLIENGKIASGLKNLRFTQSILDALNNVIAIGDSPAAIDAFLGTCNCPALRIAEFNFTGVSDQ